MLEDMNCEMANKFYAGQDGKERWEFSADIICSDTCPSSLYKLKKSRFDCIADYVVALSCLAAAMQSKPRGPDAFHSAC